MAGKGHSENPSQSRNRFLQLPTWQLGYAGLSATKELQRKHLICSRAGPENCTSYLLEFLLKVGTELVWHQWRKDWYWWNQWLENSAKQIVLQRRSVLSNSTPSWHAHRFIWGPNEPTWISEIGRYTLRVQKHLGKAAWRADGAGGGARAQYVLLSTLQTCQNILQHTWLLL